MNRLDLCAFQSLTRNNRALGIMPQRVRRHALPDSSGLSGGVDSTVELTGREWFDRVAAGEQPAPRQQYAAAPALHPPGTQQFK